MDGELFFIFKYNRFVEWKCGVEVWVVWQERL